MEGLFLLLGMVATVWFVYWSAANAARPPGAPVAGFFAYKAGREPAEPGSRRGEQQGSAVKRHAWKR